MTSNLGVPGKRAMVESMFDSIAWRYDFLNHFLSFGTDRIWRKRAISVIGKHAVRPEILDVATGTADLALASIRISPASVTGIDISRNMLEIGRKKVRKLGLDQVISLVEGDSECMPFADGSFDVAMVAFGVRNFSDPLKGLKEMHRVLRTRGFIMVLEFSKPSVFPFSSLYRFYFIKILPFFGRLLSKDSGAYKYLPDSVMKFPDNEEFLSLLREAGFTETSQVKLSGGIASIYTGIRGQKQ